MKSTETYEEVAHMWKGSLISYILGFGACFLLTTLSFLLVRMKALPPVILFYTIMTIALLQAAVQLRLFLHLGGEGKPHWETWIFTLMFSILVIVFVGSLWVMYDLNARMM